MANPRLPDYVEPAEFVSPNFSLSRPSANTINEVSPTVAQLTKNELATGKNAPIIYGEDRIAGKWLTYPIVDSGKLLFSILWSDAGQYGIEGVQSAYINGQLVEDGVDSVEITHYDGTQTTADPTLSAALSGFNDTYEGLAFSVFAIPAGTITGFPTQKQVEAVIRGRKVFDIRTSSTSYSENPALCLADWATNVVGVPVYSAGLEACADHCDDIIGGVEVRCQIGLTINKQIRAEDGYDLLSAYAECLWSFSRGLFWMVPDAPVEDPEVVLTRSDLKNLRITGNDAMRLPTRMVVSYRDPSGDASQWAEETVTRDLPAVDEGTAPAISSTVSMPGIHRSSEAERKAVTRLRRLSYPASYAWQCFDEGIKFIRGDVVQLPDMRGLSSRLCRILSIELVGLGRYQITAEHYSDDMYAFDFTPGDTINILEHMIVPFSGSTVPAGYTRWTDADGKFIAGAGSTVTPGSSGGSTSFTVSGSTAPSGAHNQAFLTRFRVQDLGPGVGQEALVGGNDSEADHAHNYSKGVSVDTPLYRQEILIQKTGTPGELPSGAMILADGQLISSTLTEMTNYLGRLMRAGDASSGGDPLEFSINLTMGDFTESGGHTHGNRIAVPGQGPGFGQVYSYLEDPDHRHTSTISVTLRPKRVRMAFYFASASTEVVPGAIAFWPESETLPSGTGWHFMDGNNGTIDIEGCLIERSSSGSAGAIIGNDTATWTGTTSNYTHDHKGGIVGNRTGTEVIHDGNITHNHSVNGSTSYRPPWYAVRLVQYTGVV